MNTITETVRPDTLTKGDYVYNHLSGQWEPVTAAYWDEQKQRYVVTFGTRSDLTTGRGVHTYQRGQLATKKRFY